MSNLAKYNISKGVSTVLTMGTPIVSMFCCGDFFVKKTSASISAVGIVCILFVLLFTKDKIAENWKVPSAMIVAGIIFALTSMVKAIIEPIQIISFVTFIACTLDEATVKSLYKRYELLLPASASVYKKFGFIFATMNMLNKEEPNVSTD